jgi:hypothetical protein
VRGRRSSDSELLSGLGRLLSRVGRRLYYDDEADALRGEIVCRGCEFMDRPHLHHWFLGKVLFYLGEELQEG